MIRFFILRHGNTFNSGDEILRVGKRTDLPLSSSGIKQIEKVADYFNKENVSFDKIFTSSLKRTKESGEIIIKNNSLLNTIVQENSCFDEIDYGKYDGIPEYEVQKQIPDQMKEWEINNVIPAEWSPTKTEVITNLKSFFNQEIAEKTPRNILIITSHGIAKFIPESIGLNLTNNKLKTAGLSLLIHSYQEWNIEYWNKFINK